jgi:hypothetical protein
VRVTHAVATSTANVAPSSRHAQQNIALNVEMRTEVVSALREEGIPFLERLGGQGGTSSGEADHCAQVCGQEVDGQEVDGEEDDSP